MLRLRHQHLQKAQGKTMDSRVNPADPNALERHILKQALRQARELQRLIGRPQNYAKVLISLNFFSPLTEMVQGEIFQS
jgi:hypothetical protein